MATVTPDEGLEWYSDRAIGDNGATDEIIYDVAVGTGSTSVSNSDTQLDNEIHRSNDSNGNVDIASTTNVGEYSISIAISGGTEVPAGSDITELGVWARDPTVDVSNVTETEDKMVYRELLPAVTLESGDRKTFQFTVTIND